MVTSVEQPFYDIRLLFSKLATFCPTKFKFQYVVPQFFNFRRTIQIAPNFLHLKCAHTCISLWLNPTGHSKFQNTSNHPPPATDSGRTARTPLYPPVQAPTPPHPYSLHLFSPVPDRTTGTWGRDRRALQQLALNMHVTHSDLT